MLRYSYTLQNHFQMQTYPHIGVLLCLYLSEAHKQETIDPFLLSLLILCYAYEF